jgi:hypothetical protein
MFNGKCLFFVCITYLKIYNISENNQRVSEWLLFNAIWTIFQLCRGKN